MEILTAVTGNPSRLPSTAPLRRIAAAVTVVALTASVWAGDVVRVGNRTLSSADLTLRQRVEQAYRDDAQKLSAAKAGVILVQQALAGEVARPLGLDVTTSECEGLAAHADATSQAPQLLAKVKALFGGDRAAYLRLYIAPKVVEQKLRGYFVHSRDLHREQIRSIEGAFAEARTTSRSLASLAARHNVEYTTFTLSEAETSGPQGLAMRIDSRRDPLLDHVRPLQPGETFHNIVENDEEFRVVRLISRDGTTTHTLEGLVARKRPYDDWYREQAARVPVVFFDPALAGEIKKQYPSLVWWPQVTVQEFEKK